MIESSIWLDEVTHKNIVDHSKCTAKIAEYLYCDDCSVSKNTLVCTAIYHDCLKFVRLTSSYIDTVSYITFNPDNLDEKMQLMCKQSLHAALKLTTDAKLKLTSLNLVCIAYKELRTCYYDDYHEFVSHYFWKQPSIGDLDFQLEILEAVALCHMGVLNLKNKVTRLALLGIEKAPLLYKRITQAILIISLADRLDSCTRYNNKRPKIDMDRDKLFKNCCTALLQELSTPDIKTEYDKELINGLNNRLVQLLQQNYYNIEKQAKETYKTFDIKEYELK